MAENIHKANHKIADDFLDETEVVTRILFVLNKFHLYDLETFDWNVSNVTIAIEFLVQMLDFSINKLPV